MKFDPKTILSKLGWSEGQGLGKQNQGNKDPIKVTYKFDKTGLGHDFSKNYDVHSTFSLSFDNAVQSLKVVPDEDGGVKVVSEAPKPKVDKQKALGLFVKSSRLNNGELAGWSSDSSDDSDTDNRPTIAKLTDEELFKICGGKTGHRAGQFGINQAAKLARIKEQDELAIQKIEKRKDDIVAVTVTNVVEQSESNPKKQKKNKKSKQDDDDDVSNESEESKNTLALEIVQPTETNDEVKQKRKKSKKETPSCTEEPSIVEVCEENASKKKKQRRENKDDIDTHLPRNNDEIVKSKKSKKRKNQTSDDPLVDENPTKKRKLSEDVPSEEPKVIKEDKECQPLNQDNLKVSKKKKNKENMDETVNDDVRKSKKEANK